MSSSNGVETETATATAEVSPDPSRAGGPSRHRISKACENCRLRRVKCTGDIPCKACTDTGISESCHVRVKARPKRPLSSKLKKADGGVPPDVSPARSQTHRPSFHESRLNFRSDRTPIVSESLDSSDHRRRQSRDGRFEDSLAFLDDVMPLDINQPGPSRGRLTHPLDQLEEDLSAWCAQHDLQLRPLLFQDEARIARLPATPLPPPSMIVEFENNLMSHLITAQDLDRLDTIDRPRLLNLYNRYRVLPTSLTEDQKALVYAVLCIARHTQMRDGPATAMFDPETPSREDVTYFHMAREAIHAWSRPSVDALWALFCLSSYVTPHGGMQDMRDILEQMAWQVRELGLHRIATSQLYPPQDMVQHLTAAFVYTDTFRASLTDLEPCIPLDDIEVNVDSSDVFTLSCLAQASQHAGRFVRDYQDPRVDVTSDEYVRRKQEEWSAVLSFLRDQKTSGMTRVKHAWAELRYHWLRILLYYPRLGRGSGAAAEASVFLLRSCSNIIHIHTELSHMGKLDPSWPQLKRIITCGQVLVICCARGEIHALESAGIFSRLFELLESHIALWPSASDALGAYKRAARVLGVYIPGGDHPSTSSIPLDPATMYPIVGLDETSNWPGLFTDFDFTSFFNMPNEGYT